MLFVIAEVEAAHDLQTTTITGSSRRRDVHAAHAVPA